MAEAEIQKRTLHASEQIWLFVRSLRGVFTVAHGSCLATEVELWPPSWKSVKLQAPLEISHPYLSGTALRSNCRLQGPSFLWEPLGREKSPWAKLEGWGSQPTGSNRSKGPLAVCQGCPWVPGAAMQESVSASRYFHSPPRRALRPVGRRGLPLGAQYSVPDMHCLRSSPALPWKEEKLFPIYRQGNEAKCLAQGQLEHELRPASMPGYSLSPQNTPEISFP